MVTQIPQESVALIARIPQEFEKIRDLITSLAQRVEKLEFEQDEDHDQQEDTELLNILTDRSGAVQSQVDALVKSVQQLETNLTLVQEPLRDITIALQNEKEKDDAEEEGVGEESEGEMTFAELSSDLDETETAEPNEEESEKELVIKEIHSNAGIDGEELEVELEAEINKIEQKTDEGGKSSMEAEEEPDANEDDSDANEEDSEIEDQSSEAEVGNDSEEETDANEDDSRMDDLSDETNDGILQDAVPEMLQSKAFRGNGIKRKSRIPLSIDQRDQDRKH